MRALLFLLLMGFSVQSYGQTTQPAYTVYSVVILPDYSEHGSAYQHQAVPVVSLFGSGVVGAMVGGAVGGLVATQLSDRRDGFGDLAMFLSGALVGIPTGSTIGVLLRGSNSAPGGRILPTLGGALLGSAASLLTGPGVPVALIVLPPLGATIGYTVSLP